MSDVGRWDAIVWIHTRGEDAEFPIEGLSLDGDLVKGDGSEGPSYRYDDNDADGLISVDDMIEFFNITKRYLTTYNLTWGGELLVQFNVEWDYGDLGSYLITVGNGPVKLAENGLYSVSNVVHEARNGSLLRFNDLDIRFRADNGTLLSRAVASLDDADGNGFISKGDSFRFSNLTIEYRGGEVFYYVEDHLVGRSHLCVRFYD